MTAWALIRSILLVAVAGVAATAMPARAETWQLSYVGLLGQVPLMNADLTVDLAADGGGLGAFHVAAFAATEGTGAAALFPFQVRFETNGNRRGQSLAPRWHRSVSTAWQGQQHIELDYRDDGSIETFVNPPSRLTADAIEAGLVTGTIDPVTAGMSLVDQIMRNGTCAGTQAVFDGIRRYDLATIESGPSAMPARATAGTGLAHGETTACRFTVGYRSGFPQSAAQSGFYPSEITIWLAPMDGSRQVVPVLAVANLSLGQLRLELVSASLAQSAQ